MNSAEQPNPLSDDEARQLAEHLSVVTQSGRPLAPALRAAADELPNRRLADALERLARDLESGQSLETVLETNPRFLPQYMRRLIEAGCRSGTLPEVLVQLVEIDRTSADLKRSMHLAIAYPLLLFALWIALVVYLAMTVVPSLGQLFMDFKTVQPWATRLLLSISGPKVMTTVAFLLAAIPMFLLGLKVSLRPLGWQRMLIELPLYGPTLLWRGVANWSRLLGLLVRHGVPLPEATKLASEGIYSPVVAVDGLRVSRMVASGRTMAEAMQSVRNLPASMVPLVRWGEEHNSLPEALDSVADMFENRVQMRAMLLQSILPPLALIGAAAGAMWIVNAMMMPLFKLITDLSGGGRYSSYSRGSSMGGGSLRWEDIQGMAFTVVIAMAVAWLVLILLVGFTMSPVGFLLGRLVGTSGRPARSGVRANVRMFLQFITWILTFILLFVAMVVTAGIWGFLLWLALIVVTISVRVRYWQMERRVLVWLLGVATEKQIPLPEAAQAFADERLDKLGVRAHRLAIALNQGLPLDRAIAATEIRLPNDALVAVRTGCAAGGLGPMLKSAARHASAIDVAIQGVVGRVAYLSIFIIFMSLVTAFIQIKIMPAMQKIYEDFHQRLPDVTLAMIRWSYFPVNTPAMQIIFTSLLLCVVLVLLYTLARYIGLLRWDPPIVRRLSLPLDESLILRSLAESVDGGKPMDQTVWMLAKRYPKGYIRRRLKHAGERINEGAHWCDSLRNYELLSAGDAGLLKAAERVGNLSWAMNQTADRLLRRFTTRLLGTMSIGFPVIVLAFGVMVSVIAMGVIFPLAQLILHLAG